MSGISLAEYDPAASRQRLHGLFKVPAAGVEGLVAPLLRRFPGLTSQYDPPRQQLLVVLPEGSDRESFLKSLVEVLDDHRGLPPDGVPEVLEIRLVAVVTASGSEARFSRHFRRADEPEVSESGEPCLVLEHGTSFGSGQHPSTCLAMAALDQLADGGPDFPGRVLDVGCGSGILALACGLFGATAVLGIDIVAEALALARANADRNQLAERVAFSDQALAELRGPYDLVVANVSGAVLSGMLADFARLIRPGGWLVVSGLQGRQLAEVAETLRGSGFAEVELFADGPWRAGLLQFGSAESV